jgi:hypothetical protein
MNLESISQEIRKKHELLYKEAKEVCNFQISDETESRNLKKELLYKAQDLFSNLSNCFDEVLEVDEYNWLSDIADKWQKIFLHLDISLDVQKEIGIIKSPKYLKSSPKKEVSRDYIEKSAFYLGAERIIWRKEHEIRELRENYLRAYSSNPNSQEEAGSNWYDACKYLSSDVLCWQVIVNFSNEVHPDLYPCFEDVWLEDVKQLKAYSLYKEKVRIDIGQVLGSEMDDYFSACKEIREILIDIDIKAPKKRFLPVKIYIENNYLKDGKLDLNKCFDKVQAKAYRIWSRTGNDNALENWGKALDYTKLYYENIISACMDKEPTANIFAVMKALKLSESPQGQCPQSVYSIANSFEAAVAIYFLQIYSCVDWQLVRDVVVI